MKNRDAIRTQSTAGGGWDRSNVKAQSKPFYISLLHVLTYYDISQVAGASCDEVINTDTKLKVQLLH